MALGILCQQFPRSIQMGVFPNAGKNIQHFASVWLRVLRAVGSEERQTICAREINQFAIDLLLPTNEMPLDFNEDIFASKDIDQKSRAILCILGSTGCQPVVCGSLPQTWNESPRAWRNCVRQAAGRYRLAACAPQAKERNQSIGKLRELAPTYCALPFLAAQMCLG